MNALSLSLCMQMFLSRGLYKTYIKASLIAPASWQTNKNMLKITCYKYLFVRTLQLLTAIIVFLSNVRDISYLETFGGQEVSACDIIT